MADEGVAVNGLFTFLFLLILACLIIGLLRPSVFGKLLKHRGSRKHIGIGFGLLLLVLVILDGATVPRANLQTTNTKAVISTQAKASQPAITTKTVTTTQPIAFTTTTEQDSSLAKGTTKVKAQGVNGVETQTYKVTYTNGKQTNRTLVSSVTTTSPVNEIIEDGTYVASATATPTPQATTHTAPSSSCHPLSNAGNCYKPGEYCRNSDHGVSGVAANGESIVCADNDGWRWEPN